jgi:hypothetical protein
MIAAALGCRVERLVTLGAVVVDEQSLAVDHGRGGQRY